MKDDISSKQSYIFQLQSCCRLLSWDPSLLQNQSHIACPRLPQSSALPTTTAVTMVTSPLAPGPRHRTLRSPLDIAHAMQLRPGLGLGATLLDVHIWLVCGPDLWERGLRYVHVYWWTVRWSVTKVRNEVIENLITCGQISFLPCLSQLHYMPGS
jgi:hypothetical protein